MKKTVCFGEIMLRLNPPGFLQFTQADSFEASYAGGEANVAVSLANFGFASSFVSKVPSHEIGQSAVNALRRYGVDTSAMIRGGDRLGAYFVEKGASQRASKVIYDRAGSAISLANPKEFDWETILRDADWFHFTGITPALGENMVQACTEAVQTAKKLGITVSCDLNYRKKLWSRESAGQVMSNLMQWVDVCIANEEDASDVFGIHAENTNLQTGQIDQDGYISVAKQLQSRFNLKTIAITLRGSISASQNNWSGMLYMNGKAHFAPNYQIQIIDRVGGGDSFGAALIYALSQNYPPQKAISFAVAASCLKHSIEQDFNLVSVQEVEVLMQGDGSGRVQR